MKPPLVRIGPVHFQSLESELGPVVPYLKGDLLDAGAGTRDISAFLRRAGVTAITRCDVATDTPGTVRAALEAMPFPDECFDAVLCNAVLEHVPDAEQSARELARVVRPGGHVVVAVPFLQPFHPSPGDYRRYTADGLADVGRRAGLEVVTVLPVHSVRQTLGWILWEDANEKGGAFRRGVAWSLAYTLTRWHVRTDERMRRNANTFQAVYRKVGRT